MKTFTCFLFVMIISSNVFALTLTSTAFSNDGNLPKIYSCQDQSLSPALAWNNAPENTKAFALILEDPDAPLGTWTHWILYNIPATTNSLKENIQTLPNGTLVGKNSWGNNEYGAPCPPYGTHHYIFRLYALDSSIPTNDDMTRTELLAAIKGHIVASTQLVGLLSH